MSIWLTGVLCMAFVCFVVDAVQQWCEVQSIVSARGWLLLDCQRAGILCGRILMYGGWPVCGASTLLCCYVGRVGCVGCVMGDGMCGIA